MHAIEEREELRFLTPRGMIAGALAFFALFWISQVSYVAFHATSEAAGVFVALAVYAVLRLSKPVKDQQFLLVIAFGAAYIALMNALHVGTFPGVFGTSLDDSGNLSLQFWIGSRVMLVAMALLALAHIGRAVSQIKINSALGGLFAAYTAGVLFVPAFPDAIGPTGRPTAFLEISLVLSAVGAFFAASQVWKKRDVFSGPTATLFLIALSAYGLGDLIHALSVSVSDLTSTVAHAIHLAGSLVAFRAVFHIAVTEPSDLLYADLKRSQAELRNERDFANSLIDAANVLVVGLDLTGRVILFNSFAERASGMPRDDVIGRSWFEVVVPHDKYPGAWQRFAAMTLELGSQSTSHDHEWSFEDPIRTASGDERTISWRCAGIRDRGVAVGIIMFGLDVTESRRDQEELSKYRLKLESLVEQRTAELAEALSVKDRFLAAMSHELRTPLNSIIGFSRILADGIAGDVNPEQERQLGMVHRAGVHLLAIVNDILDLAKIETGHRDVDAEEFELAELIGWLVDTMQLAAAEKNLELRVELPAQPILMRTDRRSIQQILMNLISNAIKFTPSGSVAVQARQVNGGRVSVTVSDTGIGIPAEDLPHVFDEFLQLKRADIAKSEGTGLGLAISRRLAELLGGSLEASSTFGAGTSFTLEIPTRILDDSLESQGVLG